MSDKDWSWEVSHRVSGKGVPSGPFLPDQRQAPERGKRKRPPWAKLGTFIIVLSAVFAIGGTNLRDLWPDAHPQRVGTNGVAPLVTPATTPTATPCSTRQVNVQSAVKHYVGAVNDDDYDMWLSLRAKSFNDKRPPLDDWVWWRGHLADLWADAYIAAPAVLPTTADCRIWAVVPLHYISSDKYEYVYWIFNDDGKIVSSHGGGMCFSDDTSCLPPEVGSVSLNQLGTVATDGSTVGTATDAR